MLDGDLAAWCDPAAPLEVIAHGFESFDEGLMKAAAKGEVPPWANQVLAEWWATETKFYRIGMIFGRMHTFPEGALVHRLTMRLFYLCLWVIDGKLGPYNETYTKLLADIGRWLDGEEISDLSVRKIVEETRRIWEDIEARNGSLEPWDEAWGWARQAMQSAQLSLIGQMTFNQGVQLVAHAWFCIEHPSRELHNRAEDEAMMDIYKGNMLDLIRCAVPLCPLVDRATWFPKPPAC